MKEELIRDIALDEGIKASLEENVLVISGPQGEVRRSFDHPKIKLTIEDGLVRLHCSKATKREKTLICSYQAHIRNIVKGVNETHVYKLRICSGHFPMNVAVSGQEVLIKNFLGESVPRKIKIVAGTQIKVEGDLITVSSADKELAGQMAARIENGCRVTNRDRRIFQDGCYMIEKAGKVL